MFIRKIGIDLGTANTLVFVPKRGIILNEPSVIAVIKGANEILAVGEEAKLMVGRTPETIVAVRPLKDGVIADYRVTEAMLRYFISKALGSFPLFKPDVMISVPAGITSTERRAVVQAAESAGVRHAYVVKEPVLAALGSGIPINSAQGNMVINIGGGTTEVAVISLGGIVSWVSRRVAGNRMDQAIVDWMKRKHSLAIGEQTAENMKINIGSAVSQRNSGSMEVRGRDLVSGLPRMVKVTSSEIASALSETLSEITDAVRQVLHETPPELAADIMDKGMMLTGGGSLLRNIDVLLNEVTGVPAYVAEEALLCVAKGTGIVLDHLDIYKRSIMMKR